MSAKLDLNEELVVRHTINKVLTKINKLKERIERKPDLEELENVNRKLDKFSQILRRAEKIHHLSTAVSGRVKSKSPLKGKLKEPSKKLNQLKTENISNSDFKNATKKKFNSNKQSPAVTKALESLPTAKTKKNYVTAPKSENLDKTKVTRKRKFAATSEEEEVKIVPKSISQLENEEMTEDDDDDAASATSSNAVEETQDPPKGQKHFLRYFNTSDRGAFRGRGRGAFQGRDAFCDRGQFRGRGAFQSRGAFHARGQLRGRGAFQSRGAFHDRGQLRGRGAFRSRGAFRDSGAFRGRGAFQSRGAFRSRGALRGRVALSGRGAPRGRGANEKKLHPSWEAKRKIKTTITEFKGAKSILSDE